MKFTAKKAIKEGFEYAGQKANDFQRLVLIKDLTEEDIKEGNYYLASVNKTVPNIKESSLVDLISNEIEGEWYDITRDDDSGIPTALQDLDLKKVVEEINEKLSHIWYRTMTEIKLINPVS